MARRMSGAERDAKAQRAWELSIQGRDGASIAAELGISRQTVVALVRDQRKLAAEELATERVEFMAEFTAEQHAAMVASWDYGTDDSASNTSRAAHIANYQRASESIAKARGLFIDKMALADKDGNTLDPIDALRALIAEHPPA